MNPQANNSGALLSVGADVSGIESLLNRNLQEVFGEGDPVRRRAAIAKIYTEDCVLYVPSALLLVTTHWTNSPAISERRIPITCIRPMARRRSCTIQGGWRGAQGGKAKRRRTPVSTLSSHETARSRLSMFTWTRRRRNWRNTIRYLSGKPALRGSLTSATKPADRGRIGRPAFPAPLRFQGEPDRQGSRVAAAGTRSRACLTARMPTLRSHRPPFTPSCCARSAVWVTAPERVPHCRRCARVLFR